MNEHDNYIKQKIMNLAVAELELFLAIIGDVGYDGYKLALCRLHGYSYGQCALKFNMPKSTAQSIWENCIKKGYDIHLRRILQIAEHKETVR